MATASNIRQAKKEKKQEYKEKIQKGAVDMGFTGTVLVFNTKEGQKKFSLVPFKEKRKTAPKKAPAKEQKSWVAMEINSVTGDDRQAIVCNSMEEAKTKALAMRNAHRGGSQQDRACVQGYAYMDIRRIDVAKWFFGKHEGRLYRI